MVCDNLLPTKIPHLTFGFIQPGVQNKNTLHDMNTVRMTCIWEVASDYELDNMQWNVRQIIVPLLLSLID